MYDRPCRLLTLDALDHQDGNGSVSLEEIAAAVEVHNVVKSNAATIPCSAFPKSLHKKLGVFDVDGDGMINQSELGHAADLYAESKKKNKNLTRLTIALAIGMLLSFLTIFGLTFAVVEMSKETNTRTDGIMTVKGTADEIIKTGAAKIEGALSSALSDEFFSELKVLRIASDDSSMEIDVNGFLRTGIRGEDSGPTSATIERVTLFTPIGEVLLIGEAMTFKEDVAKHFSKAGFKTDGRRLLSLYKLVGFFNSLKDSSGMTAPPSVAVPSFPETFTAEYEIYYRCRSAIQLDSAERCAPYSTVTDISVDGADDEWLHTVSGTLQFDDGKALETKNLKYSGSANYMNAKYFNEATKESGSWIYKKSQAKYGFDASEASLAEIEDGAMPDVAFCAKEENSPDIGLGAMLAEFFTGVYSGEVVIPEEVEAIGGETLFSWKLHGDSRVSHAEMNVLTTETGEIRRITNTVHGEVNTYVFTSFTTTTNIADKINLPSACSEDPRINEPSELVMGNHENPLVALPSEDRRRQLRASLEEHASYIQERNDHLEMVALARRHMLSQSGRQLRGARDTFKAIKKFLTSDSPIQVVYSDAQMPSYFLPCPLCFRPYFFGKFDMVLGYSSIETMAAKIPCSIAFSAELKLGIASITGELSLFVDLELGLFEVDGCIGLAVFSIDVLQVCVFGGTTNRGGHPCSSAVGSDICNGDSLSGIGGYIGGYAHANVVVVWADVWYTYYFPGNLDQRPWHSLKWTISAGLNIGFISIGGIVGGNADSPYIWYENEQGSIEATENKDASGNLQDVGETCDSNRECATTQCCWCDHRDSWRCDTDSDWADDCDGKWAESIGGCF